MKKRFGKKTALYLRVNVLAQKHLLGTLFFTPPLSGDGTTILCGHPSHVKIQPFAGQSQYLHLSVTLRPRVLIWPREILNPRSPALQSGTLPTELILLPL